MKKHFAKLTLALVLAFVLALAPLASNAAETYIEIELDHDAYALGETIIVSGSTNAYVTLGLYMPQEVGGALRYATVLSPSELSDGLEILTGEDWPEGVWKIVCQRGEVREEIEFELAETVDRSDEKPTEKPSKNHGTTTGDASVNIITLTPSEVSLKVGESATVSVDSASSVSAEVEKSAVVSASVSGKTITVKGLRTGRSDVWVRNSGNYAVLSVTVTPADIVEPTEEPTDAPTEEATDAPTEQPTESAPLFTDTASHWAKNEIAYLAERKIVSGFGDGTFLPDSSVTRAQFVTMLKNAFGLSYDGDEVIFSDVAPTDWYYESVMAAHAAGIANGMADGTFDPEALVTRQDMAVFAHRAALCAKITLPEGENTRFPDDDSIAPYAKDAVSAFSAAKVINGMDGVFNPLGTATRAQAATIIAKLMAL